MSARSRGQTASWCWVLMVLLVSSLWTPSARATDVIFNEIVRTPPCTRNPVLTDSYHDAWYIPIGFDSGSADARAPVATNGVAHNYLRTSIINWWPSVWVWSKGWSDTWMGFDDFVPHRASDYVVDFDVTVGSRWTTTLISAVPYSSGTATVRRPTR